MPIPQFTEDIAFISKLGDNPNTDNGYNSAQLKAEFDKAALAIQRFINTYIVTALNSEVSADAFLKLTGGNMKGSIDMGGNRVTGLGTPVADADAVSKAFLSAYLVPIGQGGTGGKTAEEARKNLGSAPEKHNHKAADIVDVIPVTGGGTGAQNGAEGLANLFAAGYTKLSPYQIVSELPDATNLPDYTVVGLLMGEV